MTLFVFDFDGVLFDTARECLQLAYETVRSMSWASRWRSCDAIPDEDAKLFMRYRGWVGPPWQYAVLFRCIAERRFPRDGASFQLLAETERRDLAAFTDAYFATRRRLASDFARWAALSTPLDQAANVFARLHAAGLAKILSTRDDDSIHALVRYHLGIELDQTELLERSGARNKWEILLETANANSLAPRQVFFLDDHIAHALPARECGIDAWLATWGYATPDDLVAAATAGLPCLQLSDLDRAILAHQETS